MVCGRNISVTMRHGKIPIVDADDVAACALEITSKLSAESEGRAWRSIYELTGPGRVADVAYISHLFTLSNS